MAHWKRLNTTKIFTHKRISLVEDEVRLPDNTVTRYLRFEGLLDFSTVIACGDNKIAFIREYSYPLDRFLLQFPEGSLEEGESSLQCAHRELREEAGLSAETVNEIGLSPADHRRSVTVQHVMVAEGIKEVEKTGGDTEEQGTQTVWINEDEVDTLIVAGEIGQKNTLAAWALFRAKRSKHNLK